MPEDRWTIVEGGPPPPNSRAPGVWDALWADLRLRLEQTPVKWLHVTVTTPLAYKSLASALTRRARKTHGQVEVTVRQRTLTAYVRRGPNWAQREAGSLAHLASHPDDSPEVYAEQRKQRKQRAERKNGDGADAPARKKMGRPRKTREPESE